jgi:Putative prokaryotic signal transducing protein
MKKLYCAKDPLMIGHLRNVLAAYGIDCVTRKVDLATGAGELPPIECWPELWIMDDEAFADAEAILKKTLAPVVVVRRAWICAGCGEEIEGQFSECWKCGRERDYRSPSVNETASVSGSGRHR